jgi:hypothetical protein
MELKTHLQAKREELKSSRGMFVYLPYTLIRALSKPADYFWEHLLLFQRVITIPLLTRYCMKFAAHRPTGYRALKNFTLYGN